MIHFKILPAVITSIVLFIPTFLILVELVSESKKCKGDYNFCLPDLFILMVVFSFPSLWVILYMILIGLYKLYNKFKNQ